MYVLAETDKENTASPDTGDYQNTAMWLFPLICAGLIALGTVLFRKKSEK